MSKSLLLPREKYGEASQRWGKSPLMMEIENGKQSIFYFGANHSKDPHNIQYPILREYWEKFLNTTQSRNCIVLVEGGLRRVVGDEEKAIENGSEGDLVTILANKANVPIESPELTPEESIKRLPDITKEEFFLYWFLGWFSGYQRYPDPKPIFEQKADEFLIVESRKERWAGIEVSLENVKKIYREILGEEFNLSVNSNNLINPNISVNRINAISRLHSDLRDEHIVSEVVRNWKLGKNIFITYGNGHLIIQEPALRELLK